MSLCLEVPFRQLLLLTVSDAVIYLICLQLFFKTFSSAQPAEPQVLSPPGNYILLNEHTLIPYFILDPTVQHNISVPHQHSDALAVTTRYGLLHYDYLIRWTGPFISFQPT